MKLHACMMTQNELHDLVPNVEAMLPYVDTVTIVDGGSTDGTIPHLRNWSRQDPQGRVRFFIHPWKDNFPAQRNNYLARVREVATDGDWILALDPDEFLDQEALAALRQIAEKVAPLGFGRVGFRCRSVSLRGPERVYVNEDHYWKGFLIRWTPTLAYGHHGEGPVHEYLAGMGPDVDTGTCELLPTTYWYEHRKQENIIWVRGTRNYFCGGGGPNLGGTNHRWVELRLIMRQLGVETWAQMYAYMLAGNVSPPLKEWMIRYRLEDGWDGSCFTPGQYVMSTRGAVDVETLGDADVVGTEMCSASGAPTAVTHPSVQMYAGKVVTICAVNCAPVTVTPAHPILVAERIACTREGTSGWSQHWCRPDCAAAKTVYREDPRNPAWSGAYKNCATMYAHTMRWVAAAEVEPGRHCVVYPRVAPGPGASMSLAEAELRGWYQAEGWSERGSIHLGLHESKDPLEHIIGLAREVYPDACISKYPDPARHAVTLRIGVGPVVARSYRADYGGNSVVLRAPACVWDFDAAQIQAFLRGYIGGDGCVTRKPGSKYSVVSVATASQRLAFEIQHLMSRIGVFAGYNVQPPHANRYSTRPCYRLVVEGRQVAMMQFLDGELLHSDRQAFYTDDRYYYLPCTQVSSAEYAGPVFNVETTDHTYLGAFAVHNSEQRESYKTYFRLLHPEEEPAELQGTYIK